MAYQGNNKGDFSVKSKGGPNSQPPKNVFVKVFSPVQTDQCCPNCLELRLPVGLSAESKEAGLLSLVAFQFEGSCIVKQWWRLKESE